MLVSAVGTPLIPVKIQGKDYNFWLDTGSSMTMLASDVARDLHIVPLTPDTLEIVTSTGRVKANPALIPQMVLGQVMVRNAPTMIVDEAMMQMSEPRQIEHGFPGEDRRHHRLRHHPSARSGDRLREKAIRLRDPATLRDGSPTGTCSGLDFRWCESTSTDGIPLHFGLDTGAQLTFVTETLLDKLQIRRRGSRAGASAGSAARFLFARRCFPTCRFWCGDFPIIFRGAVVRAPVYQVLASLDGVLGGDVWNAGIVRIDMTNGIFAIRRRQN